MLKNVLFILAVIACNRGGDAPAVGIPFTLAEDRAARITDLRYAVDLDIPKEKASPIRGTIEAKFTLSSDHRPIAFDFAHPPERLLSARANGKAITAKVQNGHVVIPGGRLRTGENTIELAFIAGDAALNRQDEFLYALFVPARASVALPVFDQPNLKARWTLSLRIPGGWTAVTNGRELAAQRDSSGARLTFEETKPISTYLFTFAAGKFIVDSAERAGRRYRMFHRETDTAKVKRNREAIFDLHARSLAWLEDYTGIPYPFGKFDFVLVPSFQFGGMEHPGAIYYNANSLFLEQAATKNQFLGRASVIAHETAHMWFGDLVTMRWFDDVWMKEVFANFMAAKIVNPSFPEVNHELRFFLQHYPVAYEVDRTDGANPIRQKLDNLNEAGSLYGAIIYQKAPVVMRQLELLVGAEPFRDGLREYLSRFSFGNATWPDLIAILDARTPQDLAAWSHAWVEERGRPRIVVTAPDEGRGARFIYLTMEDPLGRNLIWPQAVDVVSGRGKRADRRRVSLDGADTVRFPIDATPPYWMLPTGSGLGYGDFVLTPDELELLARTMPDFPDATDRGAALVTLWESMLEGRIAPARITDVLMTALPRESDELVTQQLLDYTRGMFWRYTLAANRPALAGRLEPLLRAGLARATTVSTKAAWFGALRNTATTRPTVAWLEDLWSRRVKIEGLPMGEPEEIELALDLAVRDVPRADSILRTQLERITNPDRKARFAFVTPALARDTATRARFFESLKDLKNRGREAWVLEGARFLHHPLRAEASKQYVVPALSLTLEIQRTGDIFFPKRWADATLNGYQTQDIAAQVRSFIDSLPPDYPQRLRWALLASADPLFRAARLIGQ